jgi:hypothetical protein
VHQGRYDAGREWVGDDYAVAFEGSKFWPSIAASSRWRVLFSYELDCVMPNDDQDIRRSLARAFDRAWDGYYRSGRLTVGQDVARTELARRLVQLSKEGIRDEGSLAEAGLNHLRQLTLKEGKTEP